MVPLPVAAPNIYFDFQGAPYSILAKQLIGAIENRFFSDILSRMCGVAGNGHIKHLVFEISCMKCCISPKFIKIWLYQELGIQLTYLILV